jgi:hypothetical protein
MHQSGGKNRCVWHERLSPLWLLIGAGLVVPACGVREEAVTTNSYATNATLVVTSNLNTGWRISPGAMNGTGTAGSHSVSPDAGGTTYTMVPDSRSGFAVEVTTSDGSGASLAILPGQTKSFSIIYTPVQAPTVELSASPSSIFAGQPATLSWISTNASSCTASWAGSVAPSSNVVVSPASTTTYSVGCSGLGGSGLDSKTITVVAAQGTLVVSSNLSTSWTISPGGLSGAGTSGNHAVTPALNGTNYTLAPAPQSGYSVAVTNSDGTGSALDLRPGQSKHFAVTYTPLPKVGVLALAISGLPVGAGGNVSVSGPNGFRTASAFSTTLSNLAPGIYQVVASSVTSGGRVFTPSPASQQMQVMSGESTTAIVTYSQVIPPSVTLSASPATLVPGQSSSLSWSAIGAVSCAALWTASTSPTGSQVVTPGSTTTYAITCTGPGGTAGASVTVTVSAQPSIGLSSIRLSFSALRDTGLLPAPLPSSQLITISNTGSGSLHGLFVTIVSQTGGNWLSASLSSNAAPATLTVRPTSANLAPGVYTAEIHVVAVGASNSPARISVVYTIATP